MKYFFTADTHFGHSNIIRYCGRPFKDVEHMNDTLVTNWNNRIKDGDTVFCAGDFCFKNSAGGKAGEGLVHKASYYTNKLNGNIIFLKGNHDRNNSVRTIIDRIVIKYGPHFVNITHIPENYDPNFAINFCGHVHEKWKFKRVYEPYQDKCVDLINIGVDVWNFNPVTFEEIFTNYRHWLKHAKKMKKEYMLL